MISHIRIQNLRSLVDTGFVEIKPLTILLGANSSGKSTFLRSFPLFKQSVEKELREPISWFDDSLVDFGDYETAKSKLAPEEEGIKFSYRMQYPLVVERSYKYYPIGYIDSNELDFNKVIAESTVTLSFKKDSKGTFVYNVIVERKNISVEFNIKDRNSVVSIMVNGIPTLEDCKTKWLYGNQRKLIPDFDLIKKDDLISEFYVYVKREVYELLRSKCSKRLRHSEKLTPILQDWNEDKTKFLTFLQELKYLTTFRKKAQSWNTQSTQFLEIYNSIAALYVISGLDTIDKEIQSLYSSCSYIAPMRAAANRYYRTQGLQVRDVDPYGKNLQEFISSLYGNKEKDYRKFTESVLGLTVMVKNSAGHQQIVLSKNGNEVNLADVGFGYSQILPIITKFWYSQYKMPKRNEYLYYDTVSDTILIEQPELHLHPAMQAKTADIIMLVLNELKKSDNDDVFISRKQYRYRGNKLLYSMIVETHSQAMINRIGRRIRDKQFMPEDVNVLLFEKDEKTGKTTIRKIEYNQKGQLTNWPYGFFEPNEDEYDSLFNRQPKE